MKFAMPDFRAAKAWTPERPARFVRHYAREIVIALVLAVVAALLSTRFGQSMRGGLSSKRFRMTSKPSQRWRFLIVGTSPLGRAVAFSSHRAAFWLRTSM